MTELFKLHQSPGADVPGRRGTDPETLRRHTLKAGAALANRSTVRAPAVASITVTVDSTFIRSREDGEHRFEVRVGNVETKTGFGRRFIPPD